MVGDGVRIESINAEKRALFCLRQARGGAGMKSFVVWGGGGCLYEVGKRDSLCNIWACPEPAELPGHDREPTCPKCLEKIKVQGGSVVRPGHDPMIYLISSDFDPLRKLTALNRLRKRVEVRG